MYLNVKKNARGYSGAFTEYKALFFQGYLNSVNAMSGCRIKFESVLYYVKGRVQTNEMNYVLTKVC